MSLKEVLPDEGNIEADSTIELHEKPHCPQVISFITVLSFGTHQHVLKKIQKDDKQQHKCKQQLVKKKTIQWRTNRCEITCKNAFLVNRFYISQQEKNWAQTLATGL